MKTRAMSMAAVPVVALFAIILLIGALGDWSPPPGSPLRGVSADELRRDFGVALEPPRPEDRPSVGPEQALEVAKRERGPDTKALEVVLARLHGGGDFVKDGQLVWVVNLDPDSFFPIPPLGFRAGAADLVTPAVEQRAMFSLIYVDAMTGEFLSGDEKGYDPDPTD